MVNGQQDLKIDFKSDKSPVTNIDLLSNEMIVDYLSKEFSDDVTSEESIKKVGHADSYWLIDPIDGTKDYIKGVANIVFVYHTLKTTILFLV